MKRLIDKLCACWCILSSREYVIFTCNKFTSAKNSKCWVSIGIDEKLPNYNSKAGIPIPIRDGMKALFVLLVCNVSFYCFFRDMSDALAIIRTRPQCREAAP